MERVFGANFADVRVHQGPEAQRAGALAYAQGADLHFAPGRFDLHGEAVQPRRSLSSRAPVSGARNGATRVMLLEGKVQGIPWRPNGFRRF